MTTRIGLLMESVQAQQQLARESIARLGGHVRNLDALTREEIRATLCEELRDLRLEIERSTGALRCLRNSAAMRLGVAGVMVLMLAGAITGGLILHFLPSDSELQALRASRDALVANIERLDRRGGRLQWRLCGERSRLCVQIDLSEPGFGEHADYRVVKGY